MTAGFTLVRIIMVGARSKPGAAAASPAAVPVFTNSRRLIRRGIGTSRQCQPTDLSAPYKSVVPRSCGPDRSTSSGPPARGLESIHLLTATKQVCTIEVCASRRETGDGTADLAGDD